MHPNKLCGSVRRRRNSTTGLVELLYVLSLQKPQSITYKMPCVVYDFNSAPGGAGVFGPYSQLLDINGDGEESCHTTIYIFQLLRFFFGQD